MNGCCAIACGNAFAALPQYISAPLPLLHSVRSIHPRDLSWSGIVTRPALPPPILLT
jgi:hypothetical protein